MQNAQSPSKTSQGTSARSHRQSTLRPASALRGLRSIRTVLDRVGPSGPAHTLPRGRADQRGGHRRRPGPGADRGGRRLLRRRCARAGGTMKGLCPFHDEKTPSFQVTPSRGFWYCFGACGEGGDVIDFMQKIDNLSFVEAVERLADRVGIQLRYTDDGGVRAEPGLRMRLVEALKQAAEYYAEQLASPGGAAGPAVPGRARLRPGGGRALRGRLRAPGRPGAAAAPAGPRLRRQGAGGRRTGPRAGLGLLPEPGAVADPGLRQAGARLRGPPAVRRRPDAGEVHQHPGNRALQEVPRALRPRPGPHGDQQEEPGGGGRGLHRRDGRAPGRGRHGGRLLRHRVRRRSCPAAAPADGRPRRVPRRGDLHLRR